MIYIVYYSFLLPLRQNPGAIDPRFQPSGAVNLGGMGGDEGQVKGKGKAKGKDGKGKAKGETKGGRKGEGKGEGKGETVPKAKTASQEAKIVPSLILWFKIISCYFFKCRLLCFL